LRIKNGKTAARFGAVAGLAVGLALAFQPVASASAAAAGMTVTPSTGLTNGASVSVSVTGFGSGETVFIGQCAYVGGEPACPTGTTPSVTANGSGAATTTLTVKKTFEGFRLDGSSVGVIDCATADCFIGAGANSGAQASVSIKFG
jgi:hypothetical protein